MSIGKRKRFEILKRDGFRCRYCGRTSATVELEVDHIKPRDKGGDDSPHNLATACKACNRGKHAVELDEITLNLDDPIEYLQKEVKNLKEELNTEKKLSENLYDECEDLREQYYRLSCRNLFYDIFLENPKQSRWGNLFEYALKELDIEDFQAVLVGISFDIYENGRNGRDTNWFGYELNRHVAILYHEKEEIKSAH